MKKRIAKIVTPVILVIVSAYLTLYTINAHRIAALYIYENPDGTIMWRTAPSGSFVPWPREPGMLEVLTEMNDVDVIIYEYFIKPSTLIAVSIVAWIVTCFLIVKMYRR